MDVNQKGLVVVILGRPVGEEKVFGVVSDTLLIGSRIVSRLAELQEMTDGFEIEAGVKESIQ